MFVTGDVTDVLPAAAMGLFESVQVEVKQEYEQDRDQKQTKARLRFDAMLEERNIDYRELALPAELPSASWGGRQRYRVGDRRHAGLCL